MTSFELKTARLQLGLSARAFAQLVRVESGRTVRRWESGEREIPGAVEVIVELMQRSATARRMLLGKITPKTEAGEPCPHGIAIPTMCLACNEMRELEALVVALARP